MIDFIQKKIVHVKRVIPPVPTGPGGPGGPTGPVSPSGPLRSPADRPENVRSWIVNAIRRRH